LSKPAPSFWALAVTPAVVNRALKVSLVVGTILAAINHGDALMDGTFGLINAYKVMLTYFVPYGVSTFSAVAALREPSSDRNTTSSQ